MQVKRITAPTMRQALQIVREQLGPDAVILSNRRVPDGIELICSLEAPEHVVSGPLQADELRAAENKPVKREITTLEKGISEWEQDARARARAIEMSLRQKLADRATAEKPKPGSAADFYEQRAASMSQPTIAANTSQQSRPASKAAATPAAAQKTAAVGNQKVASAPQKVLPAKKAQLDSPLAQPVDLTKFTGIAETPASKVQVAPEPVVASPVAHVREPSLRNDEVDALRSELQSLRTLLQGQFQHMAWMNLVQQEPARADVWKRLCRLGFDAESIQMLLQDASAPTANRLWHEVLKQLLGKLPVARGDMLANGGVFAFVGPTGAGKTTTIGKLAARAVLQHGADKVVLITTDTYRVAGHEQLRIFGRILGVKVIVVDDIAQLPAVVEAQSQHRLVLIDTAGLSSRDERLQKQLAVLASLQTRMKTFLVMPCSLQAQTQNKAFDIYSGAAPCGVILTKADESVTLGESLSLVLRNHLPVCYVADGQQVPQDVHVATAREIVQRAVLSRPQHTPDESEMAESFWQATQSSSQSGNSSQGNSLHGNSMQGNAPQSPAHKNPSRKSEASVNMQVA